MNILGINGLGIAPAACLVQDGRLTAMAEEERFTRIKGSFGIMPAHAAGFCLDFAHIRTLDEIDYIAFPWDTHKYLFFMPYFFLRTYLLYAKKTGSGSLIPAIKELYKYQRGNVIRCIEVMLRTAGFSGKIPPVIFIPHHLAHAACAFYTSGFEEADILIIDGSGEEKCTSVFLGKNFALHQAHSFSIPHSLGWFYQSLTEFLGFTPNQGEGKLMGLAGYGNYDPSIHSLLKKMISFDADGNYRYDATYSFLGSHSQGTVYSDRMVSLLGPARIEPDTFTQKYKNIAFSAQYILEEITGRLVRILSSRGGFSGKLCLAGGVTLNCKMNGEIATQEYIDDLFVPPVPHDAGAALGAALYAAKEKGDRPDTVFEHPYYGPEFSDHQIYSALKEHSLTFQHEPDIAGKVAHLLFQEKIVAWFQGRMEIGPRALGARSIVANPAKVSTRDLVNAIKKREPWRPLAPSLLDREKDAYLVTSRQSPFMAIACEMSAQGKIKTPAVVHVDGTTRPHLVSEKNNPRYWKLISEFEKLSGIPLILNTSFNIGKEPIVCTPTDAIRTFIRSDLHYLAIGDYLVRK
ncbi:MAG: hypothetical protein JXD21_00655 [Candidatus Omnitrophica bacterium]|nr:hypothetical protein [Candidatus Omnitrophota bacterium]